MKKIVFASGLLVTVFLLMGTSVVYRSFQPPQNYTGADGSLCSQCHGNLNDGGGLVFLSGLPGQDLQAGQAYPFSVAIQHPAVRNRWGFAITARDANNQPVGSFTSSNPNAAQNGVGELSHLNAVFSAGTSFSYDNLEWRAPLSPTLAQRTVTFYYSANAANGDGGTNGDFIYAASQTFQIQVPNSKPVVAITSPAANSSFLAGETINLVANASDSDGTIQRVRFYADGNLFLEDSIAPYGLSTDEAPPGIYNLTARAYDNSGDSASTNPVLVTISGCTAAGYLNAEGYTNIQGTQVADLLGNASFPGNPSVAVQLSAMEYGSVGDNYGARLRGYICAPETGWYTFYISGDDQAGLWLSTNDNPANKVLVAYTEFPVGFRVFNSSPTQQSAQIRLVKGARYYVETLHKQGLQLNHLTIAWRKPSGLTEIPLSGSALSPFTGASSGNSKSDFAIAMTENSSFQIAVEQNPAASVFGLTVHSNSADRIQIRVVDSQGQLLLGWVNINPKNLFRFGREWKAGVYIAEIRQGTVKKTLKLVKQ